MPRFDRTGPHGCGSMTGRGLGPCGRGMRRGLGRGFGRCFGWGNWQDVPAAQPVELTKEEQRKILQAGLQEIDAERKALEARLKEMGGRLGDG